jgi:type I restriction enzyme M protein
MRDHWSSLTYVDLGLRMSIPQISKKIWNLCHVLRDDGIVYHKYLSELTYLLFLKIAEETGREDLLPEGCKWSDLNSHVDAGMLSWYRKMLTTLGEDAPDGVVREIFRFPTTVFSHDENLKKVVSGISALDWHEAKTDGLGNIYESLLQRSAAEARAGAGQYFTPRPLVDCLVELLCPSPGEIIQDPAAGTGGFLISANQYLERTFGKAAFAAKPPTYQAVEIESDTYRLCLMNLFLHGMQGRVVHGDALTDDINDLAPADVIIANPPFGTSAGGARAKRTNLTHATSNKQLLFLQHIYLGLKRGGRAAVVVPDNVLYEEGAGKRVRTDLLNTCNLHTILRLPTGIFYATDVKASVLFFTRTQKNAPGTSRVWVYDLRTNVRRFRKGRPLGPEIFAGFKACFGADPAGEAPRREADPDGRFKAFDRAEIAQRDDNLDLRWMTEPGDGEDMDDRDPEEILAGILQTLQGALADVEAASVELEPASDGI